MLPFAYIQPPLINLTWAQCALSKNTESMTVFFASLLHLWVHFIKPFTSMGQLLARADVVEHVISTGTLLDVWRLRSDETIGCPVFLQQSEAGVDLFSLKFSSLGRSHSYISPSITKSFISDFRCTAWESHPHSGFIRMR